MADPIDGEDGQVFRSDYVPPHIRRTRRYWYAPQLRPPAFGGMPSIPESLPVPQVMFPGQRFHAWAYEREIPVELVEHFTLKLVHVQADTIWG